jgi:hypothetical protein
MSIQPIRKGNNWKGGRILTSHGYVRILVGTDHPHADCKGYAYEHRIVAMEMIGRELKHNEIVHHLNGVKTDNRPENIVIVTSNADHLSVYHRQRKDLRPVNGENPIRECECGCGKKFYTYDKSNRPRKYKHSSHAQQREVQDLIIEFLQQGPKNITEIKIYCQPHTTTPCSITALHKRGIIVQEKRGVWKLAQKGL